MADLRGEQLKDSYQNVVTIGTGNKLENGNGVEFADLDDKAPLSAINNDENFAESGTATMQFQGATSGVGDSFTAYWTRVMDIVTVAVDHVENVSSFEGEIELTGLPYVPSKGTHSTQIRHGGNVTYPTGTTTLQFRVNSGTTTMNIGAVGSGETAVLEASNIIGNSGWGATITYRKQ